MKRVGALETCLKITSRRATRTWTTFTRESLKSYKMRAFSYSHHEKRANDPEILAAQREAIEKSSRKRKCPGPGVATCRSSDKKVATRETKRPGDLTSNQKMRPSRRENSAT